MTSTTCLYGCRTYGLVGTVENALGPDAGALLGTVGALSAFITAIGVVVIGNDIETKLRDTIEDQDSICTTTKALGNIALTEFTATEVTNGDTNAIPTNPGLATKINAIITAINGLATPDC